jgi:hypothetical protein
VRGAGTKSGFLAIGSAPIPFGPAAPDALEPFLGIDPHPREPDVTASHLIGESGPRLGGLDLFGEGRHRDDRSGVRAVRSRNSLLANALVQLGVSLVSDGSQSLGGIPVVRECLCGQFEREIVEIHHDSCPSPRACVAESGLSRTSQATDRNHGNALSEAHQIRKYGKDDYSPDLPTYEHCRGFPMHVHDVHGAPSVHLETDVAQADITLTGAHIAPVRFLLGDRWVSPYSLAPWQPAEASEHDSILAHLRGDFFCLPFGEQADGPLHGEVSNSTWTIDAADATAAVMSMDTVDSHAHFTKRVHLQPGQRALYQRITSSGLLGDWNYGMHPTLDLSGLNYQQGRISTSAMAHRSVNPTLFSDPERGEHQILQIGAQFEDLSSIPRIDGTTLDLSRYPTPEAHEDLVMLVNDPNSGPLGWSAVVLDGYAWLALKDIRSLPMTLLWQSNGGRSQAPWNGQHVGRLGVEDVCSYFATSRAAALDNPLADQGFSTYKTFDMSYQLDFSTAHAVFATPEGFDIVDSVTPLGDTQLDVRSRSGASVLVDIDWRHVIA